MKGPYPDRHSTQRRANVVVLAAISMTVLIGFAALAIDLGLLYVTRAELQRAADAAALAGASCYYTDSGLAQDLPELACLVDQRAQESSLQNPTLHAGTILDPADIVIGRYYHDYPHAALDTSGWQRFNAVEVTARRTAESSNGPVALFFAGIFGVDRSGVIAGATAVADDRFAGLRLEDRPLPLVPFSLDIDLWDDMVANGDDRFSYDGRVYREGDGIREVDLYPWKLFPADPRDPSDDLYTLNDGGAGNFGILDLSAGGGARATSDRILNGISGAELAAEIGTSEMKFYDDSGGSSSDGGYNDGSDSPSYGGDRDSRGGASNRVTYMMSGGPGVTVSIAAAIRQRIGDVVGFPIHDTVYASGTNAEYRVVGIRFGRIMEVSLLGHPDSRRLVIQPAPYYGSEVIVSEYAPSTNGQVGRVMLVR